MAERSERQGDIQRRRVNPSAPIPTELPLPPQIAQRTVAGLSMGNEKVSRLIQANLQYFNNLTPISKEHLQLLESEVAGEEFEFSVVLRSEPPRSIVKIAKDKANERGYLDFDYLFSYPLFSNRQLDLQNQTKQIANQQTLLSFVYDFMAGTPSNLDTLPSEEKIELFTEYYKAIKGKLAGKGVLLVQVDNGDKTVDMKPHIRDLEKALSDAGFQINDPALCNVIDYETHTHAEGRLSVIRNGNKQEGISDPHATTDTEAEEPLTEDAVLEEVRRILKKPQKEQVLVGGRR